jgi:hypothetical protein
MKRISLFQYTVISLALVGVVWKITSMYKPLTFILAFLCGAFVMYATFLHLNLKKKVRENKDDKE